jgi:hypothetical protein
MSQRGLHNQNVRRMVRESRVNVPGLVATQWWPLYDYQTKAAAATPEQIFFQTPAGQSGKTINDTNMTLAGQIPKGQIFQITGVQVEFYPNLEVDSVAATQFGDDVYNFYRTGSLQLTIGSKDYIRHGNLLKFAPVNRLAGDSSTGLVTQQIQYFSAAGREFTVEKLLLESSQNFSVTLRDMPATTATARIGVTLNGFLGRNAQ